jgi:hypothetical protein
MTWSTDDESDWLSSGDPRRMLECLRGKASERKLRLLAVACHRRIFHLLNDSPSSRKTLEFAERFADGLATTTELRGSAWGKPGEAFSTVLYKSWDAAENSLLFAAGRIRDTTLRAADAPLFKEWQEAFLAEFKTYSGHGAMQTADALMPAEWVAKGNAARADEQAAQCALIREIFRSLPFRSIKIDRSGLAPEVVSLAERIYADGAFRLLPALAHALEGGTCDNAEILDHFRQTSPHVKGCWALDLLLEKF